MSDEIRAGFCAIVGRLPLGPALFPVEMVTDRSPQFIAQEIIREQLYHQLGKELPYACAVQVETWSETPDTGELKVGAVIVVERDSQKPIVEALPHVKKVHLSLFVKVLAEWSREENRLRRLGYTPDGGSQ